MKNKQNFFTLQKSIEGLFLKINFFESLKMARKSSKFSKKAQKLAKNGHFQQLRVQNRHFQIDSYTLNSKARNPDFTQTIESHTLNHYRSSLSRKTLKKSEKLRFFTRRAKIDTLDTQIWQGIIPDKDFEESKSRKKGLKNNYNDEFQVIADVESGNLA